jgi:hypothetical protein
MAQSDTIISKGKDWRELGYDQNLSRKDTGGGIKPTDYISGADFDAKLDEMMFNRVIKLKDLREKPQGNDPGKIYYDGETKQAKIWIDEVGQWAVLQYTTTSTSTTSSSSSSSSTSTTSTSTTSTSTTSSSSSTSTTTS